MRKIASVLAGLFLAMWSIVPAAQAGVIFIPIYIPMPPPVPDADPGHYTAIHTLAVMSCLGAQFDLYEHDYKGGKPKRIDIAGWHLDDLVEAQIRKYLGGRFELETIPFDKPVFANFSFAQFRERSRVRHAYLSSLPHNDIDAYLVIRPAENPGMLGPRGLALVNGDPDEKSSNEGLPTIWLNYEIDVIDARSLKNIATAFSRIQLRQGTNPSFVGLYASPKLQLPEGLTLSDEQNAELSGRVRELLPISLVETLRVLNTGAALPAVGDHSITTPGGPDPYAAIHSVAVVSAIGDRFEFEHFGVLSSPRETDRDITAWGIDAAIEAQAKSLLEKRFTVKTEPVVHMALARASLFDSNKKFSPQFPGLPTSSDVDAYVVFLKLPVTIWDSADASGLGMWNHSTLLSGDTAVFASYAVAVVDARTLKIIKFAAGTASAKSPVPVPTKVVDSAMWPKSPPDMPVADALKTQGILNALLTDSVAETLYRLRLTTPSAPSQAALP